MGIRIRQLSSLVANQIAAGEVIERPASVVKELLENSLDAQADSIHIEIDFGGLNLVKVSDNGIGIDADDLPLAIAAHATSKIEQLQDLYAITSMGFRGEALASIASVSRLTLSSKPATQEHAMMIRVDGTTVNLLPCARTQGTTIEVNDLFFNAPVRKKFLKTERSEFQAIELVVKRFALSAPHIAITLKHNGKLMFALPAATCAKTRLLRIGKLLGKNFLEQAVHLAVDLAGTRLEGWISGPGYQRSQNDKQWVYINQRMVKDKLINHALKQAYDNLLHPGRYPSCLLYLTVPAQEVDINVHPTKHEVRFQNPRLVHDLITSQLSRALAQPNATIPTPDFTTVKPPVLMEVRESVQQSSLLPSLPMNASSGRWISLNANFAVLFINEQPFLVDIHGVQQQRLQALLREQSLPLQSRPLLVPMSYSVNNDHYVHSEQCQVQLAQLGIELTLMSETQAMLRSVPLMLPYLDIQTFMAGLNKCVNPGMAELLNLLQICQSFDARHLHQEEQNELGDYVRQVLLQSATGTPWCVRLDLENCREIVHV